MQPSEVVKSMMKAGGESQTVALGAVEGGLKVAKQTPSAGNGEGHGSELAQKAVKAGRASRFRVGRIEARRSESRARRRWGRVSVMATESMSQPKMVLHVAHEASPARSFLTEMGSVRSGGSSGDSRRKTSSIADIKVR